jgi:hypothetical protein
VAIVDPEEGALRPVFFLTVCWLHDVEYDWNSILIVIPNNPLVCIGSISLHNSISLGWCFRSFIKRHNAIIQLILNFLHLDFVLLFLFKSLECSRSKFSWLGNHTSLLLVQFLFGVLLLLILITDPVFLGFHFLCEFELLLF